MQTLSSVFVLFIMLSSILVSQDRNRNKFWPPLVFYAQNRFKIHHWGNINLLSLTSGDRKTNWKTTLI